MTYRERLKMEHPNKVHGEPTSDWSGCEMCPASYGYGPESVMNSACIKHQNCADCWNSECKEKPAAFNAFNTFTKADFKPGYVVQLRNNQVKMVLPVGSNETLTLIDEKGNWSYLSAWDDKFNRKKDPVDPRQMDIMAVYGYVQGMVNYDKAGRLAFDGRPILWQRTEVKKMTVAEINAALGYEVEIVAEKE